MSMKMKTVEYASPKQILAIPDHYVALGFKHPKASSGSEGQAKLIDGRYIVQAGTIYKSGNTPIGVVLNDYDVTDGDAMMAVVIHGVIKTAALPEIPNSATISALKQITFVPLVDPGVSVNGTGANLTVGVSDNPAPVSFTIENATFRDVVTDVSKWTITGNTTTKTTVTAVALSDDKKTVTFTMQQTAAAVAGTVTAKVTADMISSGVLAQDITITLLTVA